MVRCEFAGRRKQECRKLRRRGGAYAIAARLPCGMKWPQPNAALLAARLGLGEQEVGAVLADGAARDRAGD
jgi:hypothetical protein